MKNFFAVWIIILSTSILVACQTTGSTDSSNIPDSQKEQSQSKAADINMRLGVTYLQSGDYESALEKLKKSLRQDPNLATAHNAIGLLYQTLEENTLAEKHFKKAVQLEPKYSEAQNNLGVFLCQQGRYEDAEQHFLAAIKNPLYHSRAHALENAGLCANKIPDFTLAEDYFRKALQINPNLSKSLLKMADLKYQNIDYLQARAYIQRYHSVAQWTPKALLLGIKIESKLGDKDAVSSYILLLESQFPDSNEVLQVKKGNY
ncbi:MAG: type IV pilus biogenesis/stability protein PilW [Gammaproteobacteria bacterium]|nr:MAG: type IV pilus biogenesis/stability protein PilW [Gammaproteobacteria bacterium]